MKHLGISKIITDIFKTATSKGKLKQVFHVPLYANAFYLMMNSAVTALLGFFFWLIVARLYQPTYVGTGSAAISAATLLALLSILGFDYALIRFLPNSNKKGETINSCLTVGCLASVVASLIFVAGLGIWSPALLFIRGNPIFFAAFVTFTVSCTISALLNGTFVAQRRAGFVLASSTISNLVKLTLPVLLVMFFYTFGIFASWGLGLVVALPIGIFFFLPRSQTDYRPFFAINRGVVNDMFHYSFINYVSLLLWTAPGLILPLLVINILGAEANAYFYIAWAMAGLLSAIPLATSLSLFAEGSYNEQQLQQNTTRSLKLISLLLLPAIVVIFLIGDKLLLLFGEAYSQNATTLLWVLAIASIPVSFNFIYLSVRRVQNKLTGVVGLTLFIAIATLLLSYLLLPKFGLLGVGIAWIASQGMAALITGQRLWKEQYFG
jgi:O-antigen/teichoic acid export membrane protein